MSNVFGDKFADALANRTAADSVVYMPDDFEPTFRGTIGWATAKPVFRVFSQDALQGFDIEVVMDKAEDDEEVFTGKIEYNGVDYSMSLTMAGGAFVYFDDIKEAAEFKEYIVENDGVAYVFTERKVVMPIDKIIYWGSENFKTALLERGATELVTNVGLTSISRWKAQRMRNFVSYHLLYLPSLVAAIARWANKRGDVKLDDDVEWSLQPLYAAAQYDEEDILFYTDEAQLELVGNEDKGFENSIMFQQRATLWNLFEEENPLATNPEKSEGKYGMTSKGLGNAITFALNTWTKPLLVSVESAIIPIAGLTDNNGRPLRQNIITNMFDTEDEAMSFVKQFDSVAVSEPAGKELPTAWTGMRTEWEEAVKDVKARFDSVNDVDEVTYEILSATPEELTEWW